jgi:hypothetical protein
MNITDKGTSTGPTSKWQLDNDDDGQHIRGMGKRSASLVSLRTVPADYNQFHLSNGIAAVRFLKPLGKDSFTAGDIGVDSAGRLFRTTRPFNGNAGTLERVFEAEIKTYEKKIRDPRSSTRCAG